MSAEEKSSVDPAASACRHLGSSVRKSPRSKFQVDIISRYGVWLWRSGPRQLAREPVHPAWPPGRLSVCLWLPTKRSETGAADGQGRGAEGEGSRDRNLSGGTETVAAAQLVEDGHGRGQHRVCKRKARGVRSHGKAAADRQVRCVGPTMSPPLYLCAPRSLDCCCRCGERNESMAHSAADPAPAFHATHHAGRPCREAGGHAGRTDSSAGAAATEGLSTNKTQRSPSQYSECRSRPASC